MTRMEMSALYDDSALLISGRLAELRSALRVCGSEDESRRLRRRMAETLSRYLLLTAGGCSLCPVCAKAENQPCRFPDRAISSLEAYCIQVSRLAAACGMPYHSGENTITNFGAFLFDE